MKKCDTFGAIREATIVDKAIGRHYIVITTVYGTQFSIEFANAERDQAIKIVHSLNGYED